MTHPLDAPVWTALTGRQAHLARRVGAARRIDPAYGLFVAFAHPDAEAHAALGKLVDPGETVGMVEREPVADIAGFRTVKAADCIQMVAADARLPQGLARNDVIAIGEGDARDMLALADLTRPGPFFRVTHRFGDFLGLRIDGRLAAMAGTRLAVPGYREVSSVCTHPDVRGRGLAGQLIAAVMARIRAGGDTPFLTSYADNAGAIGLYERLGFATRTRLTYTLLERG